MRKKALAAKVRAFTKACLSSEDDIDHPPNEPTDLPSQCKILIQDFKSEFDFLAESAKYSELCFMAVYKVLRELSDPRDIVCNCLNVCLRAHEGLKHATEQLNIASSSITSSQSNAFDGHRTIGLSGLTSSATVEELQRVNEQLEKEKRMNDNLQNEMADLRSR